MKRIFITFMLSAGASFAVLAASPQASEAANQDDDAAIIGKVIRFDTVYKELMDLYVGSVVSPTGIGGSKNGPRNPTNVRPWGSTTTEAPLVTPSSDASGGHSAIDATNGGIVNSAIVQNEATWNGDAAQSGIDQEDGAGRLNRAFVIIPRDEIPLLPDGVGGSVVSDGPKPNPGGGGTPTSIGGQPTKPGHAKGNVASGVAPCPKKDQDSLLGHNEYSYNGDATQSGIDQDGAERLNRVFVIIPLDDMPLLPDGVGGSVVSDGPKPNPGGGGTPTTIGGQPTKPGHAKGNVASGVAPCPKKDQDSLLGHNEYSYNGDATQSGIDQDGAERLNRAALSESFVIPFGVGGHVVSDGPKPDVGGNPTKPGNGKGKVASIEDLNTMPAGTTPAPCPKKDKDLSAVTALIDRILGGDETSSISDVTALIDSMLAR